MRRLNYHLVLAALLVACGGGDGKSDPDAAGSPDSGGTADAAVDAEPPLVGIDALCAPGGPYNQLFDKLNECFSFNTALVNIVGNGLLDGMPLERVCRGEFDPLVDDGSITIDDSKFQGCLDYIAATDCNELSLEQLRTTPCGQVIVGTIAESGACEESQQCEGDRYCSQGDGCGTCTDRLVNGVDCTFDDQCQSASCDSSGLCAAPKGLDEACIESADCLNTLICGPNDTCRPPILGVGESCTEDGDCGFPFVGSYCKFPPAPVFGISGVCENLPTVDEDCLEYPEAPGGYLCDLTQYVWCDTFTLKCQAPAISQADGPCNGLPVVGSGGRRCAEGLFCSSPYGEEPGTCIDPGYAGDSCEPIDGFTDSTCHPMFQCNIDTLECEGDYSGECTGA